MSNMYSKLEVMMTAVRQEVNGLETMKSKLKDVGKLKEKLSITRNKLKVSEEVVTELKKKVDSEEALIHQFRIDMQRLNDIHNEERSKHAETQKAFLRQEQALSHAQGELNYIQKEVQASAEQKSAIKALKLQLAKAKDNFEAEDSQQNKKIYVLEQHVKDSEKVKTELGTHVWNLTEDIKKVKADLESALTSKSNLEQLLNQAKENEIKLVESNKQIIQADGAKANAEVEAMRQKHQFLVSDLTEARRGLSSKDDRIAALEQSNTLLEETLRSEKSVNITKREELASLLATAKNRISDFESDAKKLQSRVRELEKLPEKHAQEMLRKAETIDTLQFELVVCYPSLLLPATACFLVMLLCVAHAEGICVFTTTILCYLICYCLRYDMA